MERLQRKLAEAFDEPWGDLVLRAELDGHTRFDPAEGGIVGGATFRLVDGKGQPLTVHRAALNGLGTSDAVDDWLAEVLSTLLSEHPRWPRRPSGQRQGKL